MFFSAAALREAQPVQYEPARASWVIFGWFSHLPPRVVALLLIGLPGLAVIVGTAAVVRTWRDDRGLRDDARSALAILRRRFAACFLTTATVLAGAILAAIAVHMITD